MLLHRFECLLDQIADIILIFLTVIDGITDVFVAVAQEIHDGEDLTVVGDQSFGDCIG